ncbi:MAG: hypothetical protein IJO83_04855 [Clostridia bacterium]|nr:hypothetical protein [Clostridia bacterium]
MAIFTKTGYKTKYCLTHPWKVIAHKCYDLRNAWQRANKGYSYEDVWNMDSWFLRIVPQMLSEFIRDHHGHPVDMPEEEWDKILIQMEKAFRNAYEETTEFENPYELEYLNSLELDPKNSTIQSTADEALKNNYHNAEESREKLMQQSFDEGMKLFHEHFYSLWD